MDPFTGHKDLRPTTAAFGAGTREHSQGQPGVSSARPRGPRAVVWQPDINGPFYCSRAQEPAVTGGEGPGAPKGAGHGGPGAPFQVRTSPNPFH